jgi:hypothetical protein
MKRRFFDTEIWDKEWFLNLTPADKCGVYFILSKCDAVGVWAVNKVLAEYYIDKMKIKLDWDAFLTKCNNNIIAISETKWWVPDFCYFQYSTPLTENETNKARISHVNLLKRHGLWESYTERLNDSIKSGEIVLRKPRIRLKEIPFEASPYFNRSEFTKVWDSVDHYKKYDVDYYYQAVRNWAGQDKVRANWMRTARNFALGDERDGKARLRPRKENIL